MTTEVDTWEAREQREWAIGSMARGRARAPEALDLRVALESAGPIGVAALRELAGRTYDQPVVSLYLNLSPQRIGDRPNGSVSVFDSLRHRELAARPELLERLTREELSQLTSDLDEIEGLLRTLVLDETRGLVVFKSGAELNRVVRLPVRTADSLTIDPGPYIAPLEAILEEHRPVLLVEVSKRDAHLWAFHLGRLEPIESPEALEPTGAVEAESRPGKDQRRRLTHLQWHLKATARLAARLVEEHGFRLLALAGDEIVVAELERFLPERLLPLVVRLHPSPHEEGAAWQRRLEEVVAERRRAEEEAALERLGEYQAGGVLVSGLPAALEVVDRFLVRRLFVGGDRMEPGYVCRQHHFLSLAEGSCPFCGAELFPTENLVDELIEVARLHGVELMVVEHAPEPLEPHDGVAAVIYDLESRPPSSNG